MSPDKIINRFTFPTIKKGQRQNFTGIRFHRDAVSKWPLGTTETSVVSQSSLVNICIIGCELLLRRAGGRRKTSEAPGRQIHAEPVSAASGPPASQREDERGLPSAEEAGEQEAVRAAEDVR
ncbi:hypothetical protein AV530_003639 [Patagioenas fasciata monilis]|uniref:Uncharacterized protein n=1 Tax=Patagioenas fasciata monilis TaxID=372326 RepID=A0A1V4KZM8_PATFA|nr:hypothetical protein AV530_003639 [Patagioenas fasciata monilis]